MSRFTAKNVRSGLVTAWRFGRLADEAFAIVTDAT